MERCQKFDYYRTLLPALASYVDSLFKKWSVRVGRF